MALQIHSPPSLTNKPYRLPSSTLLHFLGRSKFAVKSLNSSESQRPISEIEDAATEPTISKTSEVSGKGFGSSSSSPSKEKAKAVVEKKKERSKGRRASIIRRSPVEKPAFAVERDEEKVKEQGRNESAFLLAWLGLGVVILVEGIILAASGFLPEKWDNFFVKYLYPSFTPTVVLFVAGTVGYGVSKYLQNEKIKVDGPPSTVKATLLLSTPSLSTITSNAEYTCRLDQRRTVHLITELVTKNT